MKFSFIIGTLNRDETIKSCIDSLLAQTNENFEIIIIDQSNNEKTKEVVESYQDRRLIYRMVKYKGLSKARNEAISLATGDYICLVDDDAYYMENYLEIAMRWIEKFDSKFILSGYIYDTIKKGQFANYKNSKHGKMLRKHDMIKSCPSAALVFPKSVFDRCGLFDEQFGVGSIYGAGEETDLLLRARNNGYSVVFCKDLFLKHPYPTDIKRLTSSSSNKMASYYFGIGALYKKHIIRLHEYDLITIFLKMLIKFWIKMMLPFKYDVNEVKYEFKNLLNGYKQYDADVLCKNVKRDKV